MRGSDLDLNEPPRTEERGGGGSVARYATLMKDNKIICYTKYFNVPFELPSTWTISKFDSSKCSPMNLPRQTLYPAPQNDHQKNEWPLFMRYLRDRLKVAIINFEGCVLYIHPSDGNIELSHAVLTYIISKPMQQLQRPVKNFSSPSSMVPQDFDPTLCFQEGSGDNVCTSIDVTNASQQKRVSGQIVDNLQSPKIIKTSMIVSHSEFVEDAPSTCQPISPMDSAVPINFVRTDPSYLRTLSQTHAGWIFGAIAELVDNSRDANATRLDIFIELLYSKKARNKVPVFSVIDDGHGMSHKEIIKMLSFGHKQPNGQDPNRIGRFGIGFKADLILCARCFVRGNYRPGLNSTDFKRVDFNEETRTEWTDKETLHLLEAVLQHGEDWRKVAEHVGSRNEKECVTRFIKLPFGDQFLGPPEFTEGDRQHKKDDKESVGSIGDIVTQESNSNRRRLTPLADASNPVMAQVPFLSALVGTNVSDAAAHAALVDPLADHTPVVPWWIVLVEGAQSGALVNPLAEHTPVVQWIVLVEGAQSGA